MEGLLGDLQRVVSGVQLGITLTSLALGALGESTFAKAFEGCGRGRWARYSALIRARPGIHLRVHSAQRLARRRRRTGAQDRQPGACRTCGAADRAAFPLVSYHVSLGHRFAGQYFHAARQGSGHFRASTGTAIRTPPKNCKSRFSRPANADCWRSGEEKFILSAIEIGQIQVREIMVPRPDMHTLAVEASLEEVMRAFATTQRSRIPVYRGTRRSHPRLRAHQGHAVDVARSRARSRRTANPAAVRFAPRICAKF